MTTPSDKNTLYVLISKLGRYSPEPSRDMVLRRSLLCAADGCLGRTVVCRTDQGTAPFFIFLGLATSWLLRKDAKK